MRIGIAGNIRAIINKAGIECKGSYRDVQANGYAYKVKCPLFDRKVVTTRQINKAIAAINKEYGDRVISCEVVVTKHGYVSMRSATYTSIVTRLLHVRSKPHRDSSIRG